MAFIGPTTTLNTAMVPTTMGAVPMSVPAGAIRYAMGDFSLTGLLSSIGGAAVNYYNAGKLASTSTSTADAQAALLAQQQASDQQTALLVGAGIVVGGIFLYTRMRKKAK